MRSESRAGMEYSDIQNKAFIMFKTEKPARMVIGLEKSEVPFSARINGKDFILTYNADYADSVSNIIEKVQSDEYDEMQKELKNPQNTKGILILLSSVAYHLHTTESVLKKRPIEVQESLCKLFIDLWFCDTSTIQRELLKALPINLLTDENIEKRPYVP